MIIRLVLVLFALMFPIYWVIGTDTIFDFLLKIITQEFGRSANYRHVLAYLLCVLILLIPAGLILQVIGHLRIRKRG